jgi:hypothetical protein
MRFGFRRTSSTETRRGESFLRLARGVGVLLDESQRERGVSALHVKSGRRLFAAELASQCARTDTRLRAVAALVESLGPELLANAAGRLARLTEAGAAIARVRKEIGQGHATTGEVVGAFSEFNGEVLSALDAGSEQLGEGDVRCLALASLALQHAKEKAGVERARLGAAFVGGGPDEGDRLVLAELVAAQASYLHVYGLTAPLPVAQMLRRVLAAPPAVEVRRIEERIFDASSHPASVDAGAWFSTMTRKMEMLGDVANATLGYFPYC